MTCPYGCHDRHLRFNMQTTWICPKPYSNLYYCQHQKLCVKTRSQGTFSTQKWHEQILMMDSSWYSEIYPTFQFLLPHLSPQQHFICFSMSRWQGPIVQAKWLKIQKENHPCGSTARSFPRGFSRMKPTFISGFFTVASASVSPLQSLSFSHTASFQSCKHAQVLLPQGLRFPCFPSQVALC